MTELPGLENISTKRKRIAKLARQMPNTGLFSLSHHINMDWMREAHRQTRKDGALGVDGQSAKDYERNLTSNLESLMDRAKSGYGYRAPPVRRVYIPKGGSKELRPIGIPSYEDKVLQRAVKMVLESVYEEDFLDCSYGFRPGRSAHQALGSFRNQLMKMNGGWVLELDIRNFFGDVDHKCLMEILRQRIRDGVLVRLIGKWLKAGVLEEGQVSYPTAGTPQGGVISPLLANVYLHHVLDLWFEEEILPRLRGRAFMVRFADDAALAFSNYEDAQRVLEQLRKRLNGFGLKLHPDKTQLVRFKHPASSSDPSSGSGKPNGSLDLLGFTLYWGRSHKGRWIIKQKTAKDRLARILRRFDAWCRLHRHWKIGDQHTAISRSLKGHDAYFGVTHNVRALKALRRRVERTWFYWLMRRSQKRRKGGWHWFREKILVRYPLPQARVVHSITRSEAML